MTLLAGLYVVMASSPVSAGQSGAAPGSRDTSAFELVDTARLRHHIDRLTSDAMIERSTPSPGLEAAARYVADEFRKIGLRPGGDTASGDTSWIQRYPLPGHLQLDYAASRMYVQRNPLEQPVGPDGQLLPAWGAVLDFSKALRPASHVFRVQLPQSTVVLVAGRHTPASIRKAELREKTVLYVPASGADAQTRQAVIDELMALKGELLIVTDEDSTTFDQRRRAALQLPIRLIEPYLEEIIDTVGWTVYAWSGAIEGVLKNAGVDLARARADTAQVTARLPALQIHFVGRAIDPAGAPTASNVIGFVDGTDTTLSRETVVITARLDHAGGGLGAGDNAAGVAGLIELARAFSHPAARPRRRVAFVATSGGTTDQFWGATAMAFAAWERGSRVVTNINVDLAGRHAADSVVVDGLADLVFRVRPDWIAATPELRLTVVDGGTVAQPRSGHFAFVRRGIPSLFVHHQNDGNEQDGVRADAASNARILSFVFHVGRDIANADQPLKWNTEGRRRWLGAIGQ